MKKLIKSIFALILSAFMLISCQKSTFTPQDVAQNIIYVEVAQDASSTIDAIKVDSTTISDSTHFPLTTGTLVALRTNVAGEAAVSVYVQEVAGESVVFIDSYGTIRITTFDESTDKGYVNLSMPVGFGTQAPSVYIYKVIPSQVITNYNKQ